MSIIYKWNKQIWIYFYSMRNAKFLKTSLILQFKWNKFTYVSWKRKYKTRYVELLLVLRNTYSYTINLQWPFKAVPCLCTVSFTVNDLERGKLEIRKVSLLRAISLPRRECVCYVCDFQWVPTSHYWPFAIRETYVIDKNNMFCSLRISNGVVDHRACRYLFLINVSFHLSLFAWIKYFSSFTIHET